MAKSVKRRVNGVDHITHHVHISKLDFGGLEFKIVAKRDQNLMEARRKTGVSLITK